MLLFRFLPHAPLSFRVRPGTRKVCRLSSQITARVCRHLVELVTQVWPAECPSGTAELLATPRIMHHASRTMHHAPRTMHHALSRGVLHHARCAKYHWHVMLCAGHRACTTHPLVRDVLDGTVRSMPSAMHHYPRSHRYTVLMWMSCTTSHHDGIVGMRAHRVCNFILVFTTPLLVS